MLSSNLANLDGIPRKRTSLRIISREALALKELRIRAGLTMKAAGNAIGKSDSYVSHVENGRLDFPDESTLERILAAYGCAMKIKSFNERARNAEIKTDLIKEIVAELQFASEADLLAVRELCRFQ